MDSSARGRSVVISGDAVVSAGLVDAATDADLLLQDTLSLPIIKALEEISAGSRMEKNLHDIQDYHAHAGDLSGLVEQSGVRQLALYHLVPPPSNALLKKIFTRDLPAGTVITEEGKEKAGPMGEKVRDVLAKLGEISRRETIGLEGAEETKKLTHSLLHGD